MNLSIWLDDSPKLTKFYPAFLKKIIIIFLVYRSNCCNTTNYNINKWKEKQHFRRSRINCSCMLIGRIYRSARWPKPLNSHPAHSKNFVWLKSTACMTVNGSYDMKKSWGLQVKFYLDLPLQKYHEVNG